MQFKDAAYVILTESGEPLHYREITVKALEKNLLETAGRTPEIDHGCTALYRYLEFRLTFC